MTLLEGRDQLTREADRWIVELQDAPDYQTRLEVERAKLNGVRQTRRVVKPDAPAQAA